MVDLALLQSVSYIAGALGVCVAAVYYVLNLRITQRNQELSLKALEQSAKAQELSLKAQENSAKTQELALKAQQQNLETRQAQLFMQIYIKYQDVILDLGPLLKREWMDANDFYEKYMKSTPASDGVNLGLLMAYYEGVAVLLMKEMIDIDLVYELMPTNVTVLWSKYEGLIKEWRVRQNYPQLYRMVEWLSNRLVDYGKTRGDPLVKNYMAIAREKLN